MRAINNVTYTKFNNMCSREIVLLSHWGRWSPDETQNKMRALLCLRLMGGLRWMWCNGDVPNFSRKYDSWHFGSTNEFTLQTFHRILEFYRSSSWSTSRANSGSELLGFSFLWMSFNETFLQQILVSKYFPIDSKEIKVNVNYDNVIQHNLFK